MFNFQNLRSKINAAKTYCSDPCRSATHSRPGPLLSSLGFGSLHSLAGWGKTSMTSRWSFGSQFVKLALLKKNMKSWRRPCPAPRPVFPKLVQRFLWGLLFELDNIAWSSKNIFYTITSVDIRRLMHLLQFQLEASPMCNRCWRLSLQPMKQVAMTVGMPKWRRQVEITMAHSLLLYSVKNTFAIPNALSE